MNVVETEQRLVALVREFEVRESRELLDRAQQRATELRREAWADGRTRLHRAIVTERARARETLQHGRAELETERRRHRQRADAALLALAWERLETSLIARWRHPTTRHAWIRHAVIEAQAKMPGRPWQVDHPAAWDTGDQQAFTAATPHRTADAVAFRRDPGLAAGVRIRCEGVLFDATVQGLLSDRAWVESRLLAAMAVVRPHAKGEDRT